nr:cue domain-containing protein 3 [Quercus suber]
MSLPLLAPVPPAIIRLSLAPQEWTACLDAWLHLLDYALQIPADQFVTSTARGDHFSSFLYSLYTETTRVEPHDDSFSGPRGYTLQKRTLKLLDRLVFGQIVPSPLLTFEFLSALCQAHFRSAAVSTIVVQIWMDNRDVLEPVMQREKDSLVKLLDSKGSISIKPKLDALAPILRTAPEIAAFVITGADVIDGLVSAYNVRCTTVDRKAFVGITYLGLLSLVRIDRPNVSTLSDHLYNLRSHADDEKNGPSLLADLVTNTPLVSKLRRAVIGKSAERVTKLLDTLDTYRMSSLARPRQRRKRSIDKGKARLDDAEMHMHQMSLVSQIQDLFPDLGSGFVLRVLNEYQDDVEQVTAHLLDESLPQHLNSLDRTEQAPSTSFDGQREVDSLAPRATPPPTYEAFVPERRNAYDEDELNDLDLNTSRLHIGKRDRAPAEEHGNKAAILSALAAFDSDDDERDDTYDIEDVGGTVDSAHPDGEPGSIPRVTQEENDKALFTAYKVTPEIFGRAFNIRRSQPRAALKTETGMTDEAIEGWAIMLQRDPRRLQRLESRYNAFYGRQNVLPGTAYRESPGNTETEDSDVPTGSQRGGFRNRARGRGRGRGGNVAEPSTDAGTAEAQRRKEANKSSRANHNRRDQRAKKMARGGFAG